MTKKVSGVVAAHHALHQVTGDMAKNAFGPQLTKAMLTSWAKELRRIAVDLAAVAKEKGKPND